MTETTPNRPWGWLRRKITVFNYLLLTLPMFVIALILAAVTHSDLPYNIWAVLWAAPFLIVMAARWSISSSPWPGPSGSKSFGPCETVSHGPTRPQAASTASTAGSVRIM